MKILRELTSGFLSAIVSSIIVLGAISLAVVEGLSFQYSPVSQEPAPMIVREQPQQPQQAQQTTPIEQQPLITSTPTQAAPKATVMATPTPCPRPMNWIDYVIEPGDTVELLALRHDITPQTLRDANCLSSDGLPAGHILYLPQIIPTSTPLLPPPTVTPIPCGPPWSWVQYRVRYGDTLFMLSATYGVSMAQIQHANCMGSSIRINAGELIYLPYVRPIPTATAIRTHTPTLTSIPVTPTRTSMPVWTATFTQTMPPTATSTPIPSNTPTFTNTPITPTSTFTFTPEPTTFTPVPPTNTPITPEPPPPEE
jgi:LysM repeat protein